MPEICRFYGIIIKMYFDDHNPPHFQAEYSGHEALIDVSTMTVFSGRLPTRAQALVIDWATLHQEDLRSDWQKAKSFEPLGK